LTHLPSSWAAGIVVYGDHSKAWMLTLFTAGCLLLLSIVLRISYAKAYVFSQESRSLRSQPVSRRRPGKMRPKSLSMIVKEAKLFSRDATQWSQLLLLAALVVVYMINIKNLAIQLPMVKWIVSFINLGLAGFVLAALSVRFLFPSVSMEGRAFWIVKTLPISFRKLLWIKYLIYFPPFLMFTQMLVYFSNRILDVPGFFMHLSLLNIFAVTFALTGMAIGIGALLPNFKSDNPAKIAVGPGGLLYMLLSFVYLALMLLLQLRPVWYWVIGAYDDISAWMYFSAALILTLGVGLIPMEWGARKLATRE
jgi:ABC-2 type transport system permease protein